MKDNKPIGTTTASAAPTINTPEFADHMTEVWCAMDESRDASRAKYAALVAYIDQHASARAEEARREGYEAGLVKGYDDDMKETQELCKTDSQRTAGGDVLHEVKGHLANILERGPTNPTRKDALAAVAIIDAALSAQPVAEAAAQADDVDGKMLPEGFALAPVKMDDEMREYLQARLHSPICKAEVVWKMLLKMGLGMEDE